jgi:hypothetical protein
MTTLDRLFKGLKQLYPSGRAFRFFFGSDWSDLNEALIEEPARVVEFSKKARDGGIPGRLPSETLTDWEALFSLQENAILSDAERNDRIKARYNAVGGQGVDYLEDILNGQFQGLLIYLVFNVRCGDNNATCGNPDSTCGSFDDETDRAELVIYELTGLDPCMTNGLLIIKDVDDPRSRLQPCDPDYWNMIWYITGPDGLFSPIQLPIERKTEFVEAVLRIKPTHTWVIAQVDFV